MIIFVAHQLGHTVNPSSAAVVTGGASDMRQRRPTWSEQWRVIGPATLVMLGLCIG